MLHKIERNHNNLIFFMFSKTPIINRVINIITKSYTLIMIIDLKITV